MNNELVRGWKPPPINLSNTSQRISTRYYLDTEFIDDGERVDLISIGIACEDGRELYLQSCEFDSEKASPWVIENVYPHLFYCSYMTGMAMVVTGGGVALLSKVHHRDFLIDGSCPLPDCPWRTREQIRDEIKAFLDPAQYGKPEIYTWCGSYDHIALCQLFGPMVALPEGFPHHVYDLQCELSKQGIEDSELSPQEEGLHNALSDARHLKRLWEMYGSHASGMPIFQTSLFDKDIRQKLQDSIASGEYASGPIFYGKSGARVVNTIDPDTAIVAFMGWLTTRDEVAGPFSGSHEAGQAVELIKKFCEAQGWKVNNERFCQQIKMLKEYPD